MDSIFEQMVLWSHVGLSRVTRRLFCKVRQDMIWTELRTKRRDKSRFSKNRV